MEKEIAEDNKIQCVFFKGKNKKVQCKYYVTRDNSKQLFYNIFEFVAKYCNFHAHIDSTDFVACPVDPSHNVKASKLKAHIK